MKKMMLIAGLMAGALMLSGCGGGGPTAPAEITPAEFNTKVQGVWFKKKDGNFCIDDNKTGMSQKVAISFSRKEGFEIATKKYSEYGCHESDLNLAVQWFYDYRFGKQSKTDDSDLAAKLPYVFPLDIIYTGVKVTKGSLDHIDSTGTTYYLMVGLTADDKLEFAENDKGRTSSKTKADRPSSFDLKDEWVFERAKK